MNPDVKNPVWLSLKVIESIVDKIEANKLSGEICENVLDDMAKLKTNITNICSEEYKLYYDVLIKIHCIHQGVKRKEPRVPDSGGIYTVVVDIPDGNGPL